MARKTKSERRHAVMDYETDPFEYGATIKPFSAGFYDGEIYREFWDSPLQSAQDQLIDFLRGYKDPLIIYAHNGGKFDFLFLLAAGEIASEALIINGRIVKCMMGIHELRDSFAIIPVPLAMIEKEKIDYKIFKKNVRDKPANKKRILDYLKSDCLSLFTVVDAFIKRFSAKLTVGAMAIGELGKVSKIVRLTAEHDTEFRPYYFGGRVECFEYGELIGSFKVFDVNSMYPFAMREFVHPMGDGYITIEGSAASAEINKRTGKLKHFGGMYFLHFKGEHFGCLPTRTPTGLTFEAGAGEYHVCSHEVIAALELGLLRIDEVLSIRIPKSFIEFREFVDKYSAEKIAAKQAGDKLGEMFAKFILNSCYGKFATNPENFKVWFIYDTANDDQKDAFETWRTNNPGVELTHDMGRIEIWSGDAVIKDNAYFDVATAASITSAARSVLMRAIALANRPVYCDTDSLICEDLTGVPIDDSQLGAWKLEKTSTRVYIAGKKLYACLSPNAPKVKPPDDPPAPIDCDGEMLYAVKHASKGAKLSPSEIIRLCQGEVISWESEAPHFKMSGETRYVKRQIKRRYTVDGC